MRLPWLQVDQDGLTRCRLLARLLGVPETQGIGIGMALWQWSLEIAPDGDFRGFVPDSALLAAAVGWPVADVDRLVSELQRVGMVATSPQLRVRGLDRYIRAWEKNSGKKAKYRITGDAVPEPGANPARVTPEPARQMKTQTQTQKESSTDDAGAPIAAFHVEQPDVECIEAWDAKDFWRAAELVRRSLGYPPQKWPSPVTLSRWWSEARAVADVAVLGEAFQRFATDKHWRAAAPPAPFEAFVSKWNNYLPRSA
jgi:hypothetical protein